MKVLVAGVGVLGRALIRALLESGHDVTALALQEKEFAGLDHPRLRARVGDVTRPETIRGIALGMQVVVSCIGITRIRGRLTHMAVDYDGNLHLLREAEGAHVSLFAIVSPEGVELGRQAAPLLEARSRFENRLQQSGIPWLIVHSGGFFSDLAELAKMVRKAPFFVIGAGQSRFTPIAVSDLAAIVAAELERFERRKIHVGGPETLSWNEIAGRCFAHAKVTPRVVHVPVALCRLALALVGPFSAKQAAMGRLLIFMFTHDLPTPERGTTRLSDYLEEQAALHPIC